MISSNKKDYMGGTKEEIEQGNQIQKAWNELDNVSYYFLTSEKSNFELFDLNTLFPNLIKTIESYFDKSGIKYSYLGPIDRGGGGGFSIIELLKLLWQNKDIFSFFHSLIFFFKSFYTSYVNNQVKNVKPRIDLYLLIETNAELVKVPNNYINYMFSTKTINLTQISNSLANHITSEYNFILCDIFIESRINTKNYSANFFFSNENRNESKLNRFLLIIKNIKIRNFLYSSYKFSHLGLIKRSDSFWNSKLREFGKSTHYYLLVSTNIISDFLNKI